MPSKTSSKSAVEIIKRPIENISSDLKKSAWTAIFESLATIILGILLVAWPETMITVISYIVGAVFIIEGAYKIINYFIVKGQNDFFNNGLLSGVVAILIGVAALVIGEDIANIFRIIIGIWVIYESLVHINTAMKLQSVGIKSWTYMLILALVMLVLGIFVTFNTGAVVQLVGWMMVIAGVVGIVGDIIFIQHVNSIVDRLTAPFQES